jgi:hypothetical protein
MYGWMKTRGSQTRSLVARLESTHFFARLVISRLVFDSTRYSSLIRSIRHTSFLLRHDFDRKLLHEYFIDIKL